MLGSPIAPARGRFRWRAVAATVVVVVFALWMQFEIGGATATTWVNDLTEVLAAAVAALACLRAARRLPATRRAWTWLAAAAAAWAGGQAVWSWFELRTGEPAFPSLADAGLLLFAPFAVVGLLAFPSAPRRSRRRFQVLLDGPIIAGSLLFVSWATTLGASVAAGPGRRSRRSSPSPTRCRTSRSWPSCSPRCRWPRGDGGSC